MIGKRSVPRDLTSKFPEFGRTDQRHPTARRWASKNHRRQTRGHCDGDHHAARNLHRQGGGHESHNDPEQQSQRDVYALVGTRRNAYSAIEAIEKARSDKRDRAHRHEPSDEKG